MKFRFFAFLSVLVILMGCVVKPGKGSDQDFSSPNKAFIQHNEIDATDKSIAEYDKALFDNIAKAKIEEGKRTWPQFSEREVIAILQKQIYIGMSKEAMLVSWGQPIKINSSRKMFRKIEQYTYPGKSRKEVVYVYVEKNRIKSWQK